MRLWGRKPDGAPETHGTERSKAHGGLVAALIERFDTDAAVALVQRDWEPATDDERIAFIIAMGLYRDLVPFGNRCLDAVRRSADRHGWASGLLLALARIGTAEAIACIQEGLRARWRSGTWDHDCTQFLALPYGRAAMASELEVSFDPRVARLLADAGWQPNTGREQAAYLISRGDIAGAAEIGPDAVGPLTAALAYRESASEALEALARIGTSEACEAVIEHTRAQWAAGRSRWNDSELILQCGSRAIPSLLRWTLAEPSQAAILVEILTRLMEAPDRLETDDLRVVASMPDVTHLYYVPDDPRQYMQVVDCSDLRRRAAEVLARRGAVGTETSGDISETPNPLIS